MWDEYEDFMFFWQNISYIIVLYEDLLHVFLARVVVIKASS
jgi:hypothetical protein